MIGPAPYALVLAAGAGTRFGGAKLLAPFRGKPLVTHAALAISEAIAAGILAGGVAVLPPGDTRLAWLLDTAGCALVENPAAATGLASSLRTGIAALEAPSLDPPAGCVLIVLADQPLLRCEVIEQLVAAWWTHGRSVRPRYSRHPGVPGHPVLIDRTLWPLVHGLSGDQGFGRVLDERPDAIELIELPGANPDVDRPEDLLNLEESAG